LDHELRVEQDRDLGLSEVALVRAIAPALVGLIVARSQRRDLCFEPLYLVLRGSQGLVRAIALLGAHGRIARVLGATEFGECRITPTFEEQDPIRERTFDLRDCPFESVALLSACFAGVLEEQPVERIFEMLRAYGRARLRGCGFGLRSI
jgi:hypothetical protein